MKTLIVIKGPTGVGKTELCLHIAEYFGIPIINADSRQIFAEIPIGTAAPTTEQQKKAKHYFVGNHHLRDYYSASMFEKDVLDLLDKLFRDNDYALMSGGSMMYVDAVCYGIDDLPTVKDSIRSLMKRRLEKEGLESLVEELKQKDYKHWLNIDRNNPRRVIHALEICHQTGKQYSSFLKKTKAERPFHIVNVGLTLDRETLYNRINERVMHMIDKGLVEEAKNVYPLRGLNSLNTVGYKELFSHFDGNMSLDEAVFKIQSNTRCYCRKQQTWFKRDATTRWFHPDAFKEIIDYIDNN